MFSLSGIFHTHAQSAWHRARAAIRLACELGVVKKIGAN